MERKEENNIFKYATKELSQDAFICWLINWFNYRDELENTKNENMLVEMSKKILNKIFGNTFIPSTPQEKPCKVEDFYFDKIDIIRQFNNIDIILTITTKTLMQYLVIIEDKKEGSLRPNQQENFYINTLFESINGDSKNIRENREKLGVNTQVSKDNIIPVFWKTGVWKQTKEELKNDLKSEDISKKLICIDGIDTLEILKDYTKCSNIVKDYYKCLEEELKINNVIYVVDEIVKKQEIEIGTTFSKNYYCYNCFSNLTGKTYNKNSHSRGGGIALKKLNDKIKLKNYFYVSTINLFNADEEQWQNDFKDNYNIWLENVNDNKLETNIKYTFLFGKKRNQFSRNQYVFMGLYKLVHIEERENFRLWERQNKKDKMVSFKEENILKLVQK